MKPNTVTFQEWEYAPIIKKLSEGSVFVTPHYQDLWGAGSIISVCTPSVSKNGETAAIVCLDVDEDKLLSIIEPYRDYDVNILLIDAQKHLIGSTRPVKGRKGIPLEASSGKPILRTSTRGSAKCPIRSLCGPMDAYRA